MVSLLCRPGERVLKPLQVDLNTDHACKLFKLIRSQHFNVIGFLKASSVLGLRKVFIFSSMVLAFYFSVSIRMNLLESCAVEGGILS